MCHFIEQITVQLHIPIELFDSTEQISCLTPWCNLCDSIGHMYFCKTSELHYSIGHLSYVTVKPQNCITLWKLYGSIKQHYCVLHWALDLCYWARTLLLHTKLELCDYASIELPCSTEHWSYVTMKQQKCSTP